MIFVTSRKSTLPSLKNYTIQENYEKLRLLLITLQFTKAINTSPSYLLKYKYTIKYKIYSSIVITAHLYFSKSIFKLEISIICSIEKN